MDLSRNMNDKDRKRTVFEKKKSSNKNEQFTKKARSFVISFELECSLIYFFHK